MRIAQAIALYPPEFRGGATLVCERLSEELAARGHVLDVFSGRTSAVEPLGAVRREAVGAAMTWRVNLGGAFLPWSREGWENDVATRSFASFLDAVRPDVVHAHSLQAIGAGALGAAHAAGVPVVWTMHDWWWLCPCLFRLSPGGRPCSPLPDPERCSGHPEVDFPARRRVLARVLARVARVLVPSQHLRASLVANGFDPARVAVQENGVPPPVAGARAGGDGAHDRDRAPLRVVFVGGAGNREKGLDVLVAAAARLEREDVEVHLHCVDPAEIGAAGDRRLRFHPRFAPGEVDAVLRLADVLVVPSIMRESFSLVTREALLRGVPVVASDCGGPEEVVRPGENGLVVPTGSAAALARAIDRLAADRGLHARLAAAAPPPVATPAAHARAAEALYREVLREAERPGAPPPAAARRASMESRLAGRRVLFLVGIDGAPLRYRVWHLVEQLALVGVSCRVLYHSDLDARAAAREADLLVLYRAPFSATVAAVVGEVRRRAVPVVFSADDLIFDAGACDAPALRDPREEIARGFRWTLDAYGRSFAAADAFLGSTPELVATARAAGKAAYLHRNGCGRALVAALDRARLERAAGDPADPGAPLRVGFLSGTDTHDGDLEAIAPALARVLDERPRLGLVVGGPVAVPAALARHAERIERWPFVPWSDLAARLAALDVSLAPLELPSRFNEAKSEVKYLEASLAGVATIASPSEPFRFATRDGESALLAAGAAEWEGALVRLADDGDGRGALARRARRDVVARYAPAVQTPGLADALVEILDRGAAERAAATALPEPIAVDGGEGSSVALEPAADPYDAHQLAAETAVPLAPGCLVEQAFVARRDGLCRIDVLVGTAWRRNRGSVEIAVADATGEVVGRRVVEAAVLVDRTFVGVALERPLAASAGREVRVRVMAKGSVEGEEALLWHAPSGVGTLAVGGRAVPGRALAFRSFGEGQG